MKTLPALRIVIAGGTGQVGGILARHFHCQEHAVTVLSRHSGSAPWRIVQWGGRGFGDRALGDWAREVDGADVVINLAGRSVNCRYTRANRREIKESRIEPTKSLGRAIGEASRPPKLWLNASTATIYRHALDGPMDEGTGELGGAELNAPVEWAFSIEVAKSWEAALFESLTPGTRKIALRSAMIMSPDQGGIFNTLLKLVRLGLGGTAGSGRQFISWIHEVDFVRAIDFLIAQEQLEGCINICSPNPLPNRDFMSFLRQAYGTSLGLPAAKWMLEIGAFFVRTETELLLKSRRVVPTRLLNAGFKFSFPDWPSASQDLIGRWRKPPIPDSYRIEPVQERPA